MAGVVKGDRGNPQLEIGDTEQALRPGGRRLSEDEGSARIGAFGGAAAQRAARARAAKAESERLQRVARE